MNLLNMVRARVTSGEPDALEDAAKSLIDGARVIRKEAEEKIKQEEQRKKESEKYHNTIKQFDKDVEKIEAHIGSTVKKLEKYSTDEQDDDAVLAQKINAEMDLDKDPQVESEQLETKSMKQYMPNVLRQSQIKRFQLRKVTLETSRDELISERNALLKERAEKEKADSNEQKEKELNDRPRRICETLDDFMINYLAGEDDFYLFKDRVAEAINHETLFFNRIEKLGFPRFMIELLGSMNLSLGALPGLTMGRFTLLIAGYKGRGGSGALHQPERYQARSGSIEPEKPYDAPFESTPLAMTAGK